MSTGELLSFDSQDLQFPFELRKQISCSLILSNKTDNYVAFKVKTTNPKKYCVRPNTGVVFPRSTCNVIVTMQAQKEAPPDMQCKDKFLLQSVVARSEEGSSPTASVSENGSFNAAGLSSTKSLASKLTEEKNSVVEQNNKLQQEPELLRREAKKGHAGIPFVYIIVVGLVGMILGYLLKTT
ncbi:hypothetical protein V6N13_045638 [Hibiscus sabdariffa]|uniref:MSP domain-containing protein n=1 Tax=Hibiscus sabdariffa TaxID=183260 RepID=A0ABR2RM21_9ROSI